MNVEFQVTGANKQALEEKAEEILDRFLESRAVLSMKMDAHPIAHQFQDEHPAMWEATVRAEV